MHFVFARSSILPSSLAIKPVARATRDVSRVQVLDHNDGVCCFRRFRATCAGGGGVTMRARVTATRFRNADVANVRKVHTRDILSPVMAKKKKSKANPGGGRRKFFQNANDGPVQTKTKSAFETISTRKKFDIMGRKIKGERGNVLKSRTEAVEKRRRTLLREHEENGKANAFVDRRFGEHDGEMSVEEKNIGRLAKARLRQLKKTKTFALNDDDDDGDDDGFKTLTHLGKPLAERDFTTKPAHGEDDDDNLDDEITRNFHFGGGDMNNTNDEDPERRKSKKDVMEELIAKSKFYKAEKQKQRDDDEEILDKLDSDFKAISSGGLLSGALRKAVGHMKPTGPEKKIQVPEKDEYDVWARTLAFEKRGQAGDRAKTQEEIETQEKLALEQAERKRLKRMRTGGSDDESSDDDDGPQGGYAARRRKLRKGEDEDDNSLRKSDRKQDHVGGEDLEENFALESDEEDSDEESDGEDSDNESDSDDNDEDEDEDDEDEDLDDAARLRKSLKSEMKHVDKELEQGKNRLRKLGILQDGVEARASDEDEDEDEDDEDDEDDDDDVEDDEHAGLLREIEQEVDAKAPPDASAAITKSSDKGLLKGKSKKDADAVERVDIPFTFTMPETAAALDSMIGSHNAEDAYTIISRIRKCNAPSLAEDNRKRIQTLLGLLLQRFEVLAGQAPLPIDHLDVLSRHIVDLSAQVPFFAATAVKARVEKMSSRLRQALRDGETGWPPARTILLLSLFAAIFPTTDKSHPVTTPASLYIGNLLAHCAIRSTRDATLAVIVATMASLYSSSAERIFPEALALMSALLQSATRSKTDWQNGLPTHLAEQIGGPWLSQGIAAKATAVSLPEALNGIYSGQMNDGELAAIALKAAISCLRQLSRPVMKTPSAAELLAPVREIVHVLAQASNKKSKRSELSDSCADFVKELDDALAGAVKTPLAYHTKAVEAIQTYLPRFEEDGYVLGRDYDPNRERAEKKKLKKQLKQETRGAVRELRKDNRFMADARSKEQAAAADERGARQREVLSFLEKQESDLKSGGQGGQLVKNRRRVSKGSRRAF